MKIHFLIVFLFFVHCLKAQVNGLENNSNSISNSNAINASPPQMESEEYEIPALQEDLEEMSIEQKDSETRKSIQTTKFENETNKNLTSSDNQSSVLELSNKMNEILIDVKFNNTRKSPTTDQLKKMDKIIQQYKEINDQSFEYNYYSYLVSNYDVEKIDFLKNAEKIKPQNTDVQIQLAAYYLIKDIRDSSAYYLQKLVDVQRIDSVALEYAKDLLSSVSENGILITHGFDDSYACAYLQKVQNFRNDVVLLPFEFFQSTYFSNHLNQNIVENNVNQIIDNEYFKIFVLNNKNNNLHLSLSFPKEYIIKISEPIYIKGLSFVFNNNDNQLISDNINFYNSISKSFINNAITEKAKQFSVNYLPVLFFLKEYHTSIGNLVVVSELDDLINKISIQSNKYDIIQQIKK
jgi:hypothetical protein